MYPFDRCESGYVPDSKTTRNGSTAGHYAGSCITSVLAVWRAWFQRTLAVVSVDGGQQGQRIVLEQGTSRNRREEYEVDISDPQDRGHWAEGIGGELLSPRAGGGG